MDNPLKIYCFFS